MGKLGSQGLQASQQGLGTMGMSAFYSDRDQPADDEASIRVIHEALKLGVNFLDTSDVYGPHTNEELVGRAIEGHRGEYVIATKFAFTPSGIDGSPKYVKSACAGSLKRLGIDVIDLYYMHRKDPKVPIEDTVGGMKELVEEGKVKYLGLSEVNARDIRKAHAVHPITAVQLEWSLWSRDVEAEVVPTCRELGIGIVAYSPLGRGFFAGKYQNLDQMADDDWRRTQPRFQQESIEKNLVAFQRVQALAEKKGVTPGQLALAWVHNQGPDVLPIPGTKRLRYLQENVKARDIKLSKEELQALEEAVPASEVVGERYSEQMMKLSHNQN